MKSATYAAFTTCQALLTQLIFSVNAIRYYEPHFTDEKTSIKRLSNIPKVTELLMLELKFELSL